jgi:hypothetical protein
MAARLTKKFFDVIGLPLGAVRMHRRDKSEKVAAPPLASKRLLDQERKRIRCLHYILKINKYHLYHFHLFFLLYSKNGGMRHPKEMGVAEVDAFLTMLANERQVSPSTHRQALNAILFLYRDDLCCGFTLA